MNTGVLPFIKSKKALSKRNDTVSFWKRVTCFAFGHIPTRLYTSAYYYMVHPKNGNLRAYRDLHVCQRCESLYLVKTVDMFMKCN